MAASGLSLGQVRGLQQCATAEEVFSILAIDHRDSLRRALNPAVPAAVTPEALADFKPEVVAALAPASSAVLLDPEYGLEPAIRSGALPGTAGLIVALERSGYGGAATARRSELLAAWTAATVLAYTRGACG